MAQKSAFYIQGHHESVLRTHLQRTAANSAAYLLDSLQPSMHILDIGCGPGSISVDLAALVPEGQVIGVETSPEVLESARTLAAERGVKNVRFETGDIHALDYPDNTFDVAHAHQVLQHVGDPVQALREMRRVVKPGGLVAARATDFSIMTWYPDIDGLKDWQKLYLQVARSNGGEPNAGRRLHAWARQAGYDRSGVSATASTWCYNTADERAWWSGVWADRTNKSSYAQDVIDQGFATQNDLDHIAQAWQQWGREEDGWFGILHGEILCHV
ncbi:hypothetical protein MMC07_002315 [Pseudocyphellaria aurata]|nr:hypothetical protein [Pseudocyphellaria aurata]